MAPSKKKKHPLLFVLLAVVLVLVVAAGAVFAVLNSKVKTLQQGAYFTFRYEITPNGSQTPPLLNILQKVNASEGSLSGQYAPGRLQLSFSQLNEDGSVKTSPFTRVYIDADETLFDVRQLYNVLRQSVIEKLPLAGVILPDWTLGDYISQTQAAAVLGVETNSVELQSLSGFSLSLAALKKVSPTGARDGYLYLQFPTGADGTTIILGIRTDSIFADATPVHVMLTIPEHNVHIQLTGTLTAEKTVVTPPTSRMKDSDIAAFTQIRQSLESVWQMIQAAAQNAG